MDEADQERQGQQSDEFDAMLDALLRCEHQEEWAQLLQP